MMTVLPWQPASHVSHIGKETLQELLGRQWVVKRGMVTAEIKQACFSKYDIANSVARA